MRAEIESLRSSNAHRHELESKRGLPSFLVCMTPARTCIAHSNFHDPLSDDDRPLLEKVGILQSTIEQLRLEAVRDQREADIRDKERAADGFSRPPNRD